MSFQFQNGTIKSSERICKELGIKKFQFQNGTIKRIYDYEDLKEGFVISIPKWYD